MASCFQVLSWSVLFQAPCVWWILVLSEHVANLTRWPHKMDCMLKFHSGARLNRDVAVCQSLSCLSKGRRALCLRSITYCCQWSAELLSNSRIHTNAHTHTHIHSHTENDLFRCQFFASDYSWWRCQPTFYSIPVSLAAGEAVSLLWVFCNSIVLSRAIAAMPRFVSAWVQVLRFLCMFYMRTVKHGQFSSTWTQLLCQAPYQRLVTVSWCCH